MKSWFNCKIKYFKEDEQGRIIKLNESYLFDAVSYTEAESRVLEELSGAIRGEFTVTNITKANFVDIYNYDECDIWYKCKVSYQEYDEKSEKEKKVNQQILISADNVKDAYDKLHGNLSEFLSDFDIPSITETSIIDVYPFIEGEHSVPDNFTPIEEYNERENTNLNASSNDTIEEVEEVEAEELITDPSTLGQSVYIPEEEEDDAE
jgi:hypothetical protein